MIHKMKLNENPFERIKNGTKTVEFRLYDEKRQQIKIGDKIEFSKLPDLQEKLLVDVIELYREDTFKKLFLKLYNDEGEATEKANGMYEIYSPDKEKQYGVLGIKIKINVDSLKDNIEKFKQYNEQERVEKRVMLKYIDDFDDVLTRQNEYGHFTSSSFILNKERTKILMIYHKIYNSWAWTGGHADGELDLLGTAIRELKEETGVENVRVLNNEIFSLEIICVNGHIKRGKYVSSHVHLNLTYLLEVDENEILKIKEDENSDVKWVNIEDVEKISSEKWIVENVYKKLNEKLKII